MELLREINNTLMEKEKDSVPKTTRKMVYHNDYLHTTKYKKLKKNKKH